MSFPFQLISFHVIHVERFPKSNYDFSLGKPFIEDVFKSGLKSGEQEQQAGDREGPSPVS